MEGNLIGTTADGQTAVPNGSIGVEISGASDNRIDGTTTEQRNVISGNAFSGIDISGGSRIAGSQNLVEGNYIGPDITGTKALGNSGDGVTIFGATHNTIGGTVAGAGNAIGANALHGINFVHVSGNLAVGNTFPLSNLHGNVLKNTVRNVNGSLRMKLVGPFHIPFTTTYTQQLMQSSVSRRTIAANTREIKIVMQKLTPGVSPYRATDIHGNRYLDSVDSHGNPYVLYPDSLAPGESVTINLAFRKTSPNLYISFLTSVYAGTFLP